MRRGRFRSGAGPVPSAGKTKISGCIIFSGQLGNRFKQGVFAMKTEGISRIVRVWTEAVYNRLRCARTGQISTNDKKAGSCPSDRNERGEGVYTLIISADKENEV